MHIADISRKAGKRFHIIPGSKTTSRNLEVVPTGARAGPGAKKCRRVPKSASSCHGPGPSHQYYLDTLEMEREEKEREAALRSVYGPPKPGEPEFVSTLWTDRYEPKPEQRNLFLKWFHEEYPPL